MERPILNPVLPALSLSLLLGGCAAMLPSPADESVATGNTSAYTKSSGGPLKASQAAVQIKHADLSFTIEPQTQSIKALAKLTLQAQSDIDKVVLDLDRVFDVHQVLVDGKVLAKDKISNPDGLMTIELGHTIAKSQQTVVSIQYSGKPLVAERAPWLGGFVWDETKNGQPWIATAVQSEGCDIFWPCIDNPLREPQAVDIHLTVPAPLVGAANGKLINVDKQGDWHTYHWQTKVPINTYSISLNVGPYELLQQSYQSRFGNTIDLQYWHLEENKEGAGKLFAEFPQMLDFFESVIGPYPFAEEKMGVVDTPHLGMEHQTINAYGNAYRPDKYGFDWLLHHELSHEWFGNLITHNSQDDIWLHEGFGSYMQPLYAGHLWGDMAYHAHMYSHRQSVVSAHPLVTGVNRNDEEVYGNGPGQDTYFKGSTFIHTLRQYLGDEVFFRSVRELLYDTNEPRPGNFKPRNVGTGDYIEIVNKLSGQDLNWLFKVYLYQADLPQLVVDRGEDKLNLRWKTQDNVAFPMPVEVSVDGKLVVLAMKDNQGSIDIKPFSTINIDPQAKILRVHLHHDNYRAYLRKSSKSRK